MDAVADGMSDIAAGDSASPEADGDDSGGLAGPDAAQEADDLDGELLYNSFCVICHGPKGHGGVGPALWVWDDFDTLAARIDATMPPGQADKCTGECAQAVAAYVLATFEAPGAGAQCEAVGHPPRRVRLLSRREYRNTVRDLLWPTTGCEGDMDCSLAAESCVDGECERDPCEHVTFVFDPAGASYGEVVVAGEFNGWGPTADAGGWPMTWSEAAAVWVAKHDVEPGTWPYKFVADGTQWLVDPGNPDTAPDGFGGVNSTLTMACGVGSEAADPVPADLTDDLPPEGRPEGFGYDTNAAAGLVTALHVDGHLVAAARLAELAMLTPARLVPCDPAGDPEACAAEVVTSLGRRAFRRPLSDQERARYAALVTDAETFEDGVEIAVQALLISPWFLYRTEMGEEQADGTWRLTPWETATALSYTFWGSMPDDALLDAADDGTLAQVEGIEEQARRLLADPRARETVRVFALQWLGAEPVLTVNKSAGLHPEWDGALRTSLAEETRRFVEHVVFEGSGGFPELMTADFTIADASVAAHYELTGPTGDAFGEVALSKGRRAGVLGHGSVLATQAHSDQSSPIRRGLWVRRSLLCQELPPPPPNAGGVPDVDPGATTLERYKQHTDDPFCASCHQYIDSIGFGFEHFGPTGAWRTEDNGYPVEAPGNLNDIEGLGTKTDGPFASLPELGARLATSDRAQRCFATQWYRFGLGRLDEGDDDCVHVAALGDAFVAADLDIIELMVALARSEAFVTRGPVSDEPATEAP